MCFDKFDKASFADGAITLQEIVEMGALDVWDNKNNKLKIFVQNRGQISESGQYVFCIENEEIIRK